MEDITMSKYFIDIYMMYICRVLSAIPLATVWGCVACFTL